MTCLTRTIMHCKQLSDCWRSYKRSIIQPLYGVAGRCYKHSSDHDHLHGTSVNHTTINRKGQNDSRASCSLITDTRQAIEAVNIHKSAEGNCITRSPQLRNADQAFEAAHCVAFTSSSASWSPSRSPASSSAPGRKIWFELAAAPSSG